MKTADERLGNLVDELLTVLDEDIRYLALTLEQLDELRGAVIKRDEEGLKSLLGNIGNEQGGYRLVEKRRETIRSRMAGIFGCGIDEMNLSKLCGKLGGEKRELVARTQKELKVLAEKLRKEHAATSMLLRECARFNNMLLRGIFGNGNETVTYNDRGNASWELQRGMVSFKL